LKGEIIENRIIVWDIQESRDLFRNGYFGKPIGIPKPNPDEINVPLILDLMEGCYLLEISKIKIYRDKKKVSLEELVKICREEYHNFDKNIWCIRIFEKKNMLLTLALNLAVILQYTIEDQVLIMRHT